MDFSDRENKVMNFMDQVEKQKLGEREDDKFKSSTNYKLRMLEKHQNEAKDICLDSILSRIYKDAIPLNDEYKSSYNDDIDNAFKAFMDQRCPKGLEYYVKEGIRKGSPFAKKVLEAVDNLVKEEYRDRAFNIENIESDDLVFNSNDDVQKKLDVIYQDLSASELSSVIKDNVKQTALSEIRRAKKEKEEQKRIESELANDVNVTDQTAVESALQLMDINKPKDYVPSLFTGIMINKLDKIQPKFESGNTDVNLYGTLEIYGKESEETFATVDEVVFVETVLEYTALNVLKGLRLESFNKFEVERLAQQYAQGQIN